jgi:exonuclease III
MGSLRIVTFNINELTSPTRAAMLEAFIRPHDLDILLLQEVTQQIFTDIHGYNVYYNIGTTRRGTALITWDTLTLTNVTKIQSGRAIVANVRDILIVNIYTPSGTAKRQEREMFFNSELAYLLRNVWDNLLMGDDFNCVLEKNDCTGQYNFSRSLAELVQGYALKDTWRANLVHKVYTDYTASGANSLDRIYVSCALLARKLGVETVAAAFTGQLAVVLRLNLDAPILRRGRGI